MKVINAFIHQHRAADVIAALKAAGCRNVFVVTGEGLLKAGYVGEQHFSMDLAQSVTPENKLELLCEDDQVDLLVATIHDNSRTGAEEAGWIYVTDATHAVPY